jgi:hypothetical protein
LPPLPPRRQFLPNLIPWRPKPSGNVTLPQNGVNGLGGSDGNEWNSGAEPIDPMPGNQLPLSQPGPNGY